MQKSNYNFKNKIKIISNKQRLGAIANMYFWINRYCEENDIVVHMDADDCLIGTQTLKVLNAVYQNP